MCAIFEFWWKNFFMGMKFNFKFEIWENFYKGFPCKKKITWEFLVKWTHRKKGSLIILKLGTLKVHDKWMCGIFEFWWNNFFMGMKLNFKFEIWENFYKGFPCKKKFTWEFLVKWTKIRITGNSFVYFSVGGPRSIYKGIPN